jgi:hypothetical protein
MDKEEGSLKVRVSDLAISAIANRLNGDEIGERIRQADFIIVPVRPNPDYHNEVVAKDTRDMLRYLDSVDHGMKVEVASDDESPPELLLHSDFIQIGTIVVKEMAAPLAIGILVNYISSRIESRSKESSSSRVQCDLHVSTADGTSKCLHYNGPASTFERLMQQGLSTEPLPPADD